MNLPLNKFKPMHINTLNSGMVLNLQHIMGFGIQVDCMVDTYKKQLGKSSITIHKIWARNEKIVDSMKKRNEIYIKNIS